MRPVRTCLPALARVLLLAALPFAAAACAQPSKEAEPETSSEAIVSAAPVHRGGTLGYSAVATPAGKLHVAYVAGVQVGGFSLSGLHVATKIAGGWDTKVVASGRDIKNPRLASGPTGELHLVYPTDYSTSIAYVRETAPGTFETSTITPRANVKDAVSIAVDSAGGVHLAYTVYNPRRELWYAYRGATGDWQRTLVDNTPNRQPLGVEIRVDAAGHPQIAYASPGVGPLSSTADEIRFAERVGPSWVHSALGVGYAPAFALGPSDDVHIAFTERPDLDAKDTLVHATRSPDGSFALERIATTQFDFASGIGAGIAVDAAGAVHIPFVDTSYVDSTLHYAHKPAGGAFAIAELRAPRFDVKFRLPLVQIDAAGVANVVYEDNRELLHFAGNYPF